MTNEQKAKILKIIEKNNSTRQIYNNIVETIVAIWNKYEGKRLGEKTKEKISNEMTTKLNMNIYVVGYSGVHISVNNRTVEGYNTLHYFDLCLKGADNKFTKDNIIQKIKTSDLFYYDMAEILDPQKAVEKFEKLYKRALDIDEEMRNISQELNVLVGYQINVVDYRYNVKYL